MASDQISISRGDSGFIDVQIFNYNEEPLDLEGKQIRFTVKKNKNDPDIDSLISLGTNSPGGIKIVNARDGTCRITLQPEHTRDIQEGSYFYDVKVVWEDVNMTRRKTVLNSVMLIIPVVWKGEEL